MKSVITVVLLFGLLLWNIIDVAMMRAKVDDYWRWKANYIAQANECIHVGQRLRQLTNQ
jgi:hypothetical protein